MAPVDGLVAARERLHSAEVDLRVAVGVRLEYEHALLGVQGSPRVRFRSYLDLDGLAARNPETFDELVYSARACEARAFAAYVQAAESLWILERGLGPSEMTDEVST